jgi:DNA polymerase I
MVASHYQSSLSIPKLVSKPDSWNIYCLDAGILPALSQMKRNGIYCHKPLLDSTLKEYAEKIEILTWEIRSDLNMPDFNPASPEQVARLIFNDMGLRPLDPNGVPVEPKLTKTKTRFSSDDSVLSAIKSQHSIIPKILTHRSLSKVHGTYLQPIYKFISPYDSKIRSNWKYTRTTTGRLANDSPNMMNWPSKGPDAAKIRNLIQAYRDRNNPRRKRKLVSVDLSQIEMRIGAHCAEDVNMIEAFWLDQDLHTITAAGVFFAQELLTQTLESVLALVDKHLHRLPSKTLNFGIFYGLTPQGLQTNILEAGGGFWPIEACEDFIDKWFARYPGVRRMLQDFERKVRQLGYSLDMFGRTRAIPEVRSSIEYIRSAGIRQASNMPIQSGAQGIIKMGMRSVVDYVLPKFKSALPELCLQVHDELVLDVDEEAALDLAHAIVHAMENVIELLVPIKAEFGIGDMWGELK